MRLVTLAAIPALAIMAAWPASAHGPEEHGSKHGAGIAVPGDPDGQARIVEISMQEGDGKMLFAPDVVTVSKGEQVRFRLKNDGALDHEFFLGTPEEIEEHADMMKAMPDMKHDEPLAKRFGPKEGGSIVVKFTEVGEFEFACLIPGHREAGMKGKIIVK